MFCLVIIDSCFAGAKVRKTLYLYGYNNKFFTYYNEKRMKDLANSPKITSFADISF